MPKDGSGSCLDEGAIMRMRFDFDAVAGTCGTTREQLGEHGFSPEEFDGIGQIDAADLRLSTYVRLCDALGCSPGELPLCVDDRGSGRDFSALEDLGQEEQGG